MTSGNNDRHDDLVQIIGVALLDLVPADFRRIDLIVSATGRHPGDLGLTLRIFYPTNGSDEELPEPVRLRAAFTELRQLITHPQWGQWLAARCVVNSPDRIDITYNFAVDSSRYSAPLELPEQNALLGALTTQLVLQLPGQWEQLFVDFGMIGDYVHHETSILTIYGSHIEWRLPEQALPLLIQLRNGMARPETGTWLAMKLQLVHPDTYNVTFNRDKHQGWMDNVSKRQFSQELQNYPRASQRLVPWLAAQAGVLPPRNSFSTNGY